jgi:predicted AlkP superfamily phosphohydrolase/phosphomutase
VRSWLSRQERWASKATRLARFGGRERLLSFADVDWGRTLAYARGHMGQVYLNVQGREPQGMVPLAEYASARDRVVALLKTLHDPADGRALVDAIIPREEAASGPYAHAGPDLHVMMDGYRALAYPLFAADGRIVTQQPWGDSGSHRREGILIASGPTIRHGRIHAARLEDLAPTILHLLGVPVVDDMDGRVLTSIFTDTFQQQPVVYQPPLKSGDASIELTSAMQATLEERLRTLGYLG